MYRTYRNLYKVRPAISSLGTGKQRIRLPKGVTITLDTVLLFILLLLPARIIVAPILGTFLMDVPWVYAIMAAGMGAFYAGKLDPAGKPISSYIFDLVCFSLRIRWHDGWESRTRFRRRQVERRVIKMSLVNDGCVASLPARGKVEVLELKLAANISVKNGKVIVTKKGKRQNAPGKYKIEGKQVSPFTSIMPKNAPPSLLRTK